VQVQRRVEVRRISRLRTLPRETGEEREVRQDEEHRLGVGGVDRVIELGAVGGRALEALHPEDAAGQPLGDRLALLRRQCAGTAPRAGEGDPGTAVHRAMPHRLDQRLAHEERDAANQVQAERREPAGASAGEEVPRQRSRLEEERLERRRELAVPVGQLVRRLVEDLAEREVEVRPLLPARRAVRARQHGAAVQTGVGLDYSRRFAGAVLAVEHAVRGHVAALRVSRHVTHWRMRVRRARVRGGGPAPAERPRA
jgi:hypothetical protein